MAIAVYAETFDNFQQSTRLILESRSCTLNSSRKNLKTKMLLFYNFMWVDAVFLFNNLKLVCLYVFMLIIF
jgi:hypothetical protein